ncbi:hypothetical protein M0802_003145 [Mischocyttarus mexicanus]|nr:hypothetical protein M0802_003145 [Mischocyttarus mexicanus]
MSHKKFVGEHGVAMFTALVSRSQIDVTQEIRQCEPRRRVPTQAIGPSKESHPSIVDHDPSPVMADAATTSRNNSKVLVCQVKL